MLFTTFQTGRRIFSATEENLNRWHEIDLTKNYKQREREKERERRERITGTTACVGLLTLLKYTTTVMESGKFHLINTITYYQKDLFLCHVCQSNPEFIIILMSWLGSSGPLSFVCWRASWGVWRNKARSLEHEAFSTAYRWSWALCSSLPGRLLWEAANLQSVTVNIVKSLCTFNCYYVHGIWKVALDI